MLILPESIASQVLTPNDALEAMREMFVALSSGAASTFPVVSAHGVSDDEHVSIKAGRIVLPQPIIGMKTGSYWPRNRTRGEAAHGSTTLLLDPDSGRPYALVGASVLTCLRTAAADALAVQLLAREDATVLGIIGAGHQALYDLDAVRRVRPISRVYISTRSAERADAFVRKAEHMGLPIEPADPERTAREADILITVTPSTTPLVKPDWVKPGTHVSAMGADRPGKQELEADLVATSRLFADWPSQSAAIGEFQAAVRSGAISADRITSIGDVARGRAPGRRSEQEISIFDSSGLSLQDLVVAKRALDVASTRGLAIKMPW